MSGPDTSASRKSNAWNLLLAPHGGATSSPQADDEPVVEAVLNSDDLDSDERDDDEFHTVCGRLDSEN